MSRAQTDSWSRIRSRAFSAPWLSETRERELLALAQQGDRGAMDELCATHLRLVVDIAGRYRCSTLQAEDLVSEGTVGLVEAIRRFDLSHATRLSAYAAWWIRARVRGYVDKHSSIVPSPSSRGVRLARAHLAQKERELAQQFCRQPTRAELATSLDLPEGDIVAVEVGRGRGTVSLTYADGEERDLGDLNSDPEQLLAGIEARSEVADKVRAAIASLQERERTIVDAHFLGNGSTMEEIGARLSISRQRVSQIVQRACQRLEHTLSGLEMA
jgi:RNA polymerase sigma factor (sigma-70 family)